MKTKNELASTLTEAELADVHGGQAAFHILLDKTHARVQAVADSIDRLAVLDPRMLGVLRSR